MRRRTIAGLVAAVAAVGLVIGVSVVWPGLDAQETPEVDPSVWALQTGDGRRYARVNTTVGELDTVRSVSNPDKVVQAGDSVFLFSDSLSKVTKIDEALPADLDDEALRDSQPTPAGTTDVATAGDFVAYRTDSGAIFAGLLSGGAAVQLDPFPSDDEDAQEYTADAIAVDDRGILFSYSRADGVGAPVRHRRLVGPRPGPARGRGPLDVRRSRPRATRGPSSTPRTATCGSGGRMPPPPRPRRGPSSSESRMPRGTPCTWPTRPRS